MGSSKKTDFGMAVIRALFHHNMEEALVMIAIYMRDNQLAVSPEAIAFIPSTDQEVDRRLS